MTEQDRIAQVQTAIAEREQETPHIVTGMPGVCMATLAAPNCILVAQWITPSDPYIYCLS